MTTTNTRIVSGQPTIGSRPTSGATESESSKKDPKGKKDKTGKGKWVRLIGMLIVVAAVAVYWFMMGPGAGASDDAAGDGAVAGEVEYKLGEVMVVEPISINLTGGHYLRLGLGLQLTADAGTHGPAIDSAKALDAAISLYSGRTTEELATPAVRDSLKAQLSATLKDLYDEQVVGVYYTDFVTQ